MSKKKPKVPKSGMTDEERVALAAVNSLGGSLAGEADVGEMQALIAAAKEAGKRRKARARKRSKK